MKKFVVLGVCFVFFGLVGVPALFAHAADTSASVTDTATLNQELSGMQATLLDMQARLQGSNVASPSASGGSPASALSAGDLQSLSTVFAALQLALAEIQIRLQSDGSAISPGQRLAVNATLNTLGTDLVGMEQALGASAPVALAAPAQVPAPVSVSVKSLGSAPAPAVPSVQTTASIPATPSNQNVQVAQVSAVAPWTTWGKRGWSIAIVIVILVIAAIVLLFRPKKAEAPVVVRSGNKPDASASGKTDVSARVVANVTVSAPVSPKPSGTAVAASVEKTAPTIAQPQQQNVQKVHA